MSSTLPRIPEDEFEKDRERREAERKRKLMRRRRGKDDDPVRQLRRLRRESLRRLEDDDYPDADDFGLGDDYDYDRLDGDDFFDRLERGSFDHYD